MIQLQEKAHKERGEKAAFGSWKLAVCTAIIRVQGYEQDGDSICHPGREALHGILQNEQINRP